MKSPLRGMDFPFIVKLETFHFSFFFMIIKRYASDKLSEKNINKLFMCL